MIKVKHKSRKKHQSITTTRIIMLGFIVGIILGTLLLMLPISVTPGNKISPIDALFIATSSICVTGLATVNIGLTFSAFGQAVLLFLIQIGGLGVVTFTMLFLIGIGHRINLSDRLLLMSAYNTDSIGGLLKLTEKIVKVTLVIELIGAFCYSFVFVPQYGAVGIWYSIFHSVSAFCNAGIDLLGKSSFNEYVGNPIINTTTICLIVAGGLGFPVYWEIERIFRERKKDCYKKKLSLQAKIVLSATAFLILSGAIVTYIFECNNPDTIGNLNLGDKIWACLFQSVTLRTAGFATIDQCNFTEPSCLVYIILMIIGGSPSGTAGGIKTVTFIIIIASTISNIRGEHNVVVFKRTISDEFVRRCLSIATFSISVWVLLTILLLFEQQCNFLDAIYEMASAIATVGLSRGLTGELTTLGKLLVSLTMYLGRIGPITLALAFNYSKKSHIESAKNKIIIG